MARPLQEVSEPALPARVDLHCHTIHSEDREEIPLPNGASVTLPFRPMLTPLEAYETALERGMTHVTFTDHDTLDGCLELLEHHPHPDRFFFGEEVTCFHQRRMLHVGVYGLTEADHRTLHAGCDAADRETRCLRWNVPQLLRYLDERGLVYDLKHPLWSPGHYAPERAWLEAVVPWFSRVEGINGTRRQVFNEVGAAVARRLRPDVAFTGGSDTHSDNHGRTWTETEGDTPEAVLTSLRAGRCRPAGTHGSHWRLERDGSLIISTNLSSRAETASTVLEASVNQLPLVLREVVQMSCTALIAYGTVQEMARQRRLAEAVRGAFDLDPIAAEAPPAEEQRVAAATDARAVRLEAL